MVTKSALERDLEALTQRELAIPEVTRPAARGEALNALTLACVELLARYSGADDERQVVERLRHYAAQRAQSWRRPREIILAWTTGELADAIGTFMPVSTPKRTRWNYELIDDGLREFARDERFQDIGPDIYLPRDDGLGYIYERKGRKPVYVREVLVAVPSARVPSDFVYVLPHRINRYVQNQRLDFLYATLFHYGVIEPWAQPEHGRRLENVALRFPESPHAPPRTVHLHK